MSARIVRGQYLAGAPFCESDRMILRWVGRLIEEVPKEDPFRPKILRHFKAKIADD